MVDRRPGRARRALAHISDEKLREIAIKNGARFGLAGQTVIYLDPITKVEKTARVIRTWKTSACLRMRGESQWIEKEYIVAIIY